jgi:hypothetical protein
MPLEQSARIKSFVFWVNAVLYWGSLSGSNAFPESLRAIDVLCVLLSVGFTSGLEKLLYRKIVLIGRINVPYFGVCRQNEDTKK